MTQVIIDRQRRGTQLDGLAGGVQPALRNVRTRFNQDWILKQVVGRAILLKDDDDVLDLSRGDRGA
jgi:hypothetical protein